MAKEIFWFVFGDEPNTQYKIDEPINFGNVDFSLDQKDGQMGRDVSLSGGKVQLKFTKHRTHYLEKLLYVAHTEGFEGDVKLFIQLENGDIFVGELDFYTATTNDFDYFYCSVILESALQIFKRRSETKVDLFSDVDINGEVITPLEPINMLLQAKPDLETSLWMHNNQTGIVNSSFPAIAYNPCVNLKSYGVQDSFTFFSDNRFYLANDAINRDNFKMLRAVDNKKNIKITLKGVQMVTTNSSELFLYYADKKITLKKATPSVSFSGDITYTIDSLERDQELSILFRVIGNNTAKIESIEITAESTSYNSITPTFRLIDVMKHVAKSISGLEINAPRYDVGGQFYDTVLTNGNLLRNIQDKPFYVSWDDIEKSINPEHNADNEIQPDGRIFVGIEDDFYTNEECGFFDNTQFSGLKKQPNPLYCLNKFVFKYAKYQSLKENTEPNSESTIHGESQLTPFNQKVENSREAAVQWTRDAILLSVQQKQSIKVSSDTATQDDDTLFAIDTISTEVDQVFTESTSLQHTWDGLHLSLRTNGEVNFNVLGIKEGTSFVILSPDANFGNYTVFSVSESEVLLTRLSLPGITSVNNGIRLTKYQYEIEVSTIPLTNRTNQGFGYVLNLLSPEKYSNLRYSVERNIRNYWGRFLATVNMYHKNKPIRNTFYKNNGKCSTEFGGLAIIEKEDFTPVDPIVTADMYEEVVFANVDFSDYIMLQNMIRTKRGFVRTIDNNNRVLKLFTINISYENKARQLTISGQEKFEQSYLNIISGAGLVTINDETRLKRLLYKVEDNKIVLFDAENQKLYNGIFWDQVSVNGEIAETLEILKSWLDLLI